MNWSAAAAVLSAVGLLITIGIGIFVYGRLTQKVEDNGDQIKELRATHGLRLDKHEDQLNEQGISLGRLHEWKDGFNAGARKLGTSEARD